MNKPLLCAVAVMALLFSAAGSHAAANPTAEPMDIDPSILSKMALERAKTRGQAYAAELSGKASDGLESPSSACGAVNIGNVVGGNKIGFQPRDVTVVITGDVINANNNCH